MNSDWRFVANHRVNFCDYWRPAANRQRPSQASDWCPTASPFKISGLGSPAPPGAPTRRIMTSLMAKLNAHPDSGLGQFMPAEPWTLQLFVDMLYTGGRMHTSNVHSTHNSKSCDQRPIQGHFGSLLVHYTFQFHLFTTFSGKFVVWSPSSWDCTKSPS